MLFLNLSKVQAKIRFYFFLKAFLKTLNAEVFTLVSGRKFFYDQVLFYFKLSAEEKASDLTWRNEEVRLIHSNFEEPFLELPIIRLALVVKRSKY